MPCKLTQAENERSFKLLQEYLRQAREGGRDLPTARVAYRFCFYVRGDYHQPHTPQQQLQHAHAAPASGASGGVSSGDAPAATAAPEATQAPGQRQQQQQLERFAKVELTLPPPAQPVEAPPGADDPERTGDAPARSAEGAQGPGGSSAGPTKARARLAPSVRKALARLLRACGVPVRSCPTGPQQAAIARTGALALLAG